MFSWIVIIPVEIYTLSYAYFELKNGNRKGFAAILSAVIFSMGLFLKYLT